MQQEIKDKPYLSIALSEADHEIYAKLYIHAQQNPKKYLQELLDLQKRNPNTPEVLNLLAYTYIKLRKLKKAEKIIEYNYLQNKDHLISKINYADLLLRKKKYKKIQEIFADNFDLTSLYPDRKTFQISEYRAFHTLMGFYHLAIKNKEAAISHHLLAHKIDPENPAVKLLGQKLYRKSFFQRVIELKKE